MARILSIGVAALNIINTVDGYPEEGSRVRAIDQRIALGGRAANILVVLRQFGHQCTFGGMLAGDSDGQQVLAHLTRYGIDTAFCRTVRTGRAPKSYITLNCRTGSRTVVHFRELPRFSFDDFAKIDLAGYDWAHFDARNVPETVRMLARIRHECPSLPISVEVERPRVGGEERLFDWVDVLLFTHSYVTQRGFREPWPFLRTTRETAPRADLVCTWGNVGVYGLSREGREVYSPCYPPRRVLDTVGANSAFNAGIIDTLLNDRDLNKALNVGCRLAGQKCSQIGLDGLASE